MSSSERRYMESLLPFIPGGFMEHFIRYMELTHPDVVRYNLSAVKFAGAALFANVAHIYTNDYRLPPASMFLVFVGPPRCGKGSILGEISNIVECMEADGVNIHVTGESTPEALARELQEYQNVIMVWEEVGGTLRRIGGIRKIIEYYQGIDKLLNKAYYLSTIRHIRKDQNRVVIVPSRSYYLSCFWDCTPHEWGAIESLLGGPTGFSRRVLKVRMADYELPYFGDYKPTPDAEEHFEAMIKIAKDLNDKCFFVDVTFGFLEDKIARLDEDPLKKALIADYTRKLTAIALTDMYVANPQIVRKLYTLVGNDRQRSTRYLTNLTNITHIITISNDITKEADESSDWRVLPLTIYNLITRHVLGFTSLADEDVHAFATKTIEFLKKKGGVCIKREWVWEVAKGRKKTFYEPILQTLEEMGIVKVLRHRRAIYIIDADHKCCATCMFFRTPMCKAEDPFGKPCENYTPEAPEVRGAVIEAERMGKSGEEGGAE